MSPILKLASRGTAVRRMATLPGNSVATFQEKYVATRVASWQPKKSDPIEGLAMGATLGGTLLLCLAPAFYSMMQPAAGDDH